MISSLNDIKSVAQYLRRIGADVRSLRTAVVREMHGTYWKDLAVIRFSKKGAVDAPEEYAPTDTELAAIVAECETVEWPEVKFIKRLHDLPPQLKNADPKDIYEFRNEAGEIVMLQLRNYGEGNKYLPFTFWSDNKWRTMEPEGKLPLWGMDKIKDNSTVFIHEGAKAARYVQWMIEGQTKDARDALAECPWKDELVGAVHVGWIGGAMNPARTDWSPLKRAGIKRAYIVSDNDAPGVAAVPNIAYQLRVPTFHIQFTSDWPASFDLADKFPEHMFEKIEGKRFYNGPSFRNCKHPATWATDQIPPKPGKDGKPGKGRPTAVLRDSFKEIWAYIEEADIFVCTEMPETQRTEQVLNKMLASFSHVSETSRLIVKAYTGRTTRLCYRPDAAGRIIINKGTTAINLHIASEIKAQEGDPSPWLEFMTYMFPSPEECYEMQRWCATLIARPDLRMEYGVLLVSEKQGIGKTTLGTSILAPLVGVHNTSFPGENDITTSEFNDWLAHKRLAVISEIYSGHSWKAYNRLKNFITDKDVSVNQKFQRKYVIENWCHMMACSNSLRALKMEDDDRRWLYPEVTEVPWPRAKFVALHQWLQSGGLQIIMHWAKTFDAKHYVYPGQRAPMTARKKDLIEGSRTDAQKEAAELAEAMNNYDGVAAVSMKDVEAYVKSAVQGKVFDTDYDLRKAMKEAGAVVFKSRITVGGRLQYVIMNRKLYEDTLKTDAPGGLALVQKSIKKAQDILPANM